MVAAKEAELVTLMASLGEFNSHSPTSAKKRTSSLNEQLAWVTPLVDLKVMKEEKAEQFAEIKAQIYKIDSDTWIQSSRKFYEFGELGRRGLVHGKLNDYKT